jgi:hypothetical protein
MKIKKLNIWKFAILFSFHFSWGAKIFKPVGLQELRERGEVEKYIDEAMPKRVREYLEKHKEKDEEEFEEDIEVERKQIRECIRKSLEENNVVRKNEGEGYQFFRMVEEQKKQKEQEEIKAYVESLKKRMEIMTIFLLLVITILVVGLTITFGVMIFLKRDIIEENKLLIIPLVISSILLTYFLVKIVCWWKDKYDIYDIIMDQINELIKKVETLNVEDKEQETLNVEDVKAFLSFFKLTTIILSVIFNFVKIC